MTVLVNEPMAVYGQTQNSSLSETKFFRNRRFENSTVFPNSLFPQFSDSIAPLLQKILSFEKLKNNWDSYGAAAPAKQAIANALSFIIKNQDVDLPFYFIAPGVDGEVMIEFNQGNKAAELYFNPDESTELLFFEDEDLILEGNLEENFTDLVRFF